MKDGRKIEIQQRVIDELEDKNKKLLDEIYELRKNIHEYESKKENQKQLEDNLRQTIKEYLVLIDDVMAVKQEYLEELRIIKVLKNKYKESMKNFIKSIKHGFGVK